MKPAVFTLVVFEFGCDLLTMFNENMVGTCARRGSSLYCIALGVNGPRNKRPVLSHCDGIT